MSAGVHDAWFGRTVWHIILFLDRQCIHICPQGNYFFIGIFSFDQTHYTSGADHLEGNTEMVELLLYKCGCFKLLVAQFGMRVQVMSDSDEVGCVGCGQALDLFFEHTHASKVMKEALILHFRYLHFVRVHFNNIAHHIHATGEELPDGRKVFFCLAALPEVANF